MLKLWPKWWRCVGNNESSINSSFELLFFISFLVFPLVLYSWVFGVTTSWLLSSRTYSKRLSFVGNSSYMHWYVSKYTYILYCLNPQNDQKHTNDHINAINIIEMCFYVIQVQKDWKQVKNKQSSHNCHFQSLEFHKLAKLVPEGLKWKKSQL